MDQLKPQKLMKTLIYLTVLLGFSLVAVGFLLVDSLRFSDSGSQFASASTGHSSVSIWGLTSKKGDYLLASADSTATPTPFQPLPPTAFALQISPSPTEIPASEPAVSQPSSTPYLYEVIATATPAQVTPPAALESTAGIPGLALSPTSTQLAPSVSLTATLTGTNATTAPTPELVLTAAPELEQLPRQINVLILGADRRPYEAGFRTDTIILVTVNTELGRVNFTSFPRDLWLMLPDWGMSRINTAWTYGGWNMLHETFKHNFGIEIDYHVLVDFGAFKKFVDDMGGLDVTVKEPVSDYRRGYWVNIKKGQQHMDADTVLWYVRTRKTTNDIARNQRQQEVIQAIIEKMVSIDGIKRAPELFDLYDNSIKTDIRMLDVMRWLPFMAKVIETRDFQSFAITYKQVYDWITPEGAMVLVPQKDAMMKVIRQSQNLQ